MATTLKMVALVLSLGVDTLLMSVSLGFVRTRGKWKVALVFVCAEALMPLIGLFIGQEAGRLIGQWTSLLGGVALLCVAVWLLFFDDDRSEERYDDESDDRSDVHVDDVFADSRTNAKREAGHDAVRLQRSLKGWALILTALSVSLDELAVGFSIGLVGVPIMLTIILIALQSFLFTMIGLAFGSALRPLLGEWTEKLAGVVLLLLGLWIGVEAVVALAHGHHL